MASEEFGEYRFLLQKKKKTTFRQRIKYIWLTTSKTMKTAYFLLLILFLGISMTLVNLLYMSKGDHSLQSLENILQNQNEKDDILRLFQSDGDRKILLQECEKRNETLLPLKKLLTELHEKASLDQKSGNQGGSKSLRNLKIMAKCALILEDLKRIVKKCGNIDILPKVCKRTLWEPIHCSEMEPYRRINGSCNNLDNPHWGMSATSNSRYLKAVYDDDISLPRKSISGDPLPNARQLSSTLFSHRTLTDSNTTMMFSHFGLFLDHDIIRTGQPQVELHKCCQVDFQHPACMEIEVGPSDYFYGPLNVTCIGFTRDSPSIGECPGRREQLNRMTAFVDASDLYGPNNEDSALLRAFKDGKLLTSTVHNTSLLPTIKDDNNSCYTRHTSYKCFGSGDIRCNMLLPLMTIHTVWAREHNRLAEELQALNPSWDDEKLFHEARRILIAELQCITYREFLPIIFGHKRMKKYGLHIDENNIYDGYDRTEDPSITNVFSAAAFRFGHTLIQKYVYLVDADYNIRNTVPLHKTYLNPTILFEGGLDDVVRGMTSQSSQLVERYTTEEIRGRLFQYSYQNHGLDLTAISIQRGRDHGLPSYLQWRKFCNLSSAKSWEDLKDFMRVEYVEDLKNAYNSIEDIDIIPGAIGENHEKDTMIGPTYLCILSKQFLSLRKGDRFWFENLNQPGSFTRRQLKEIYKTSLARFLCHTSDNLTKIQKFPFWGPSEENPILPCEDYPKMDLSLWKE